ncbi:MAG: glycosyltransferase, partial [Alphaproteobacteria bacterium]|nr:glycosyltransferase [Alphaproteobacteria bacterium]
WALRRMIKDHNIEGLHVHSRAPAWACYLLWIFCQIPYSATVHGAHKCQNYFKRLYNSGLLRGRHVIAVSQFIHQFLREHYPTLVDHKIIDIFEGIHLEKFCKKTVSFDTILAIREKLKIPFYHKIVLFPGRMTRIKGHQFYIDAFQHLPENLKKSVTTVFIGGSDQPTPYQENIENQARTHQMTCHFLPAVDDLKMYYAMADVVVAPSQVPESFGRVVAEALAMEAVVVSIDHGGVKELSNDGRYAFLSPLGDSLSFAQNLEKALSLSVSEKKMLTEHTRAHLSQSYDLNQMLLHYQHLVYDTTV